MNKPKTKRKDREAHAKVGSLRFVVHKHKSTALHYDLRLEIGDSMPSWSVPKGPTLDNRVRRLAMPTGPHDVEYRKFEGNIPYGRPGAGPVMIWDEGTYNPEVELEPGVRAQVTSRRAALEVAGKGLSSGMLKFTLFGTKLKGSFALVRTAGFGGKESWLLIKHKDEFVDQAFDPGMMDYSAATGRSLEQIGSQEVLSGKEE